MQAPVRSSRHGNTRVGADEWTHAALAVIAQHGVGGVRVELLAEQLAITKGSFYWHFRDRQDLVERALELWWRVATVDVIERLDRIDDPLRRLRALFAESFGDVVNGPIDALLLARVDDPVVGPTVIRVTAERLDFLARTYRRLGLPAAAARARSQLVYAAYIGAIQLRAIPGAGPEGTRQMAAFDRQLELLLVP